MIGSQIIEKYLEEKENLEELLSAITLDLGIFLKTKKFQIQTISSRVKSQKSIQHKVARPDRTYADMWDVTDLLGIRIITYFEDSIEAIGKEIEKKYEVDLVNSENKLNMRDNQTFGYRSLHYDCYIPSAEIKKARFEIQIRTVLQHAWAEIEHDIGYKSNEEIPGAVRRRFSQVAGLLEIADREFVTIRNDLLDYEQKVLEQNPKNILLDLVSITSLVTHPAIEELDLKLAKLFSKKISENVFYPNYLLKMLTNCGLKTLDDILKKGEIFGERVEKFAKAYFEFTRQHWSFDETSLLEFQKGYSLLFICHMEILYEDTLLINRLKKLSAFYEVMDYMNDPTKASEIARLMIDHFSKKNLI